MTGGLNLPRDLTASLVFVGEFFHGRQHVHVYRLFPHIKGSENANMTCLWRTIVSMIEHGLMPKDQKLFIQMDGGSENTNQTLIRFAAWLCQQRICRSVSFTYRIWCTTGLC